MMLAEMLYSDIDHSLTDLGDKIPDPDVWHDICNKASFLFCNWLLHNNLSLGELSMLHQTITNLDSRIGAHIDDGAEGYFRFYTFLQPGFSVYWLGQYFAGIAGFMVDPTSADDKWKSDIIRHIECAKEIIEEGIGIKEPDIDLPLELGVKLLDIVQRDITDYKGVNRMDLTAVNDMKHRIHTMVPEFHGWYQGFSDAAFWTNGSMNNEVTVIAAPDLIVVDTSTGHLSWDFDPGSLWDIIIWGDDGGICLFRVKPQDDAELHQVLLEFSTTEGIFLPDWRTPSREDFIAEYNRQRTIIESRYAYIPGSNR